MLASNIKTWTACPRAKLMDMNALVVGKPEYYTPRAKLVRIKYENSTRYEYMIHHAACKSYLQQNNIQP